MAKNDTPQTITAYHGDPDENSMTFYEKWKKSRYGFPAIFFSEGKKVAGEYALAGRRKRGVIWEVKVQPVAVEIDLENIRSYGSKFRNLIYELHDGGYHSARLRNVFDRPQGSSLLHLDNLIVVFDIDRVVSWTPKFRTGVIE